MSTEKTPLEIRITEAMLKVAGFQIATWDSRFSDDIDAAERVLELALEAGGYTVVFVD